MSHRLRVALAIESSRCFGRNLLAGIAAYAYAHGPWSLLHQERSINDPLPPSLKRWRPQGVIARIVDGYCGRAIRRVGVPVVDLLNVVDYPEVPRVLWNSTVIASMAADHLLDRGFRHFGFVGYHGLKFSDERRKAMCKYVAGRGFSTHVFEEHGVRHAIGQCEVDSAGPRQMARLGVWLSGLPKPIGLMACNDVRANQVLAACREREIPVPDRVAVVGVDNDALLCQLCDPPLTSIDPASQRIGYEAAALLHRMIEGERPATHDLLIDPAGVVARQSTDLLAIADPAVIKVVRYLREHACEGVTPADLVSQFQVSRSTIERWFTKELGRSPSEEIARVKLERVKDLLATTNLTLERISRLAGYSHGESMYRVFRQAVGQTPGEYRISRNLGNSK